MQVYTLYKLHIIINFFSFCCRLFCISYSHGKLHEDRGEVAGILLCMMVIFNFVSFHILFNIWTCIVAVVCHLMRAVAIFIYTCILWNETEEKNLLLHIASEWTRIRVRSHAYTHSMILFAFSILGIIDTPTYTWYHITSHITCSRCSGERKSEIEIDMNKWACVFSLILSLSMTATRYFPLAHEC